MKQLTRTFGLILMVYSLSLLACKEDVASKKRVEDKIEEVEEASAETSEDTSEETFEETSIETPEDTREPNDDELREYGLVSAIEDGAYPFYSITISFPERDFKQSFNLNIEAVSQDVDNLNKLKDQYVTFYYLSEEDNMIMDIHFEGKSLDPDSAPEHDASWKKAIGTLMGATTVSGDTPDNFTVTDDDGTIIHFNDFITEALVLKNEKEITVYYSQRFVNTITYLKASEN